MVFEGSAHDNWLMEFEPTTDGRPILNRGVQMIRQTWRHDVADDLAREMVCFVAKWAPFGGGDEDVLPTFGVHPIVFYSRVATLIRSDPGVAVGHDAEKLVAYCERKSGFRRRSEAELDRDGRRRSEAELGQKSAGPSTQAG